MSDENKARLRYLTISTMLLTLKMTVAAKAALIAVIMIVWYILVESALQMRVRYAAALFRCVNFVRKLENEEVRRHAASPAYLRGGTFKTICTTGDLRMSMTIGPEKFVKAQKTITT